MDRNYEFYKSMLSPNGKMDFICMIVNAVLGIYLLFSDHSRTGILLIFVALLILGHLHIIPHRVCMTDLELLIGDKQILWDSIKKVNFKIDGIGD